MAEKSGEQRRQAASPKHSSPGRAAPQVGKGEQRRQGSFGSASTSAPAAAEPMSAREQEVLLGEDGLPVQEEFDDEWQRKMDEAEEVRRKMEERRRQEIDEIRRAEADQRKARERERQMREEMARRDANERQKMLDSIERPLMGLLEKLELAEDLALPLAKRDIFTLEDLLAMPRSQLAQSLSMEAVQALDRVVVAARRSVALEKIAVLVLPEDEEWEKAAAQRDADLQAEQAEAARKERIGNYAQSGYYGKRNKNADEEGAEAGAPSAAPPVEAKPHSTAGPLRKALVEVVDRWYDYLGTVPALGEILARANAGCASPEDPDASDDVIISRGPTASEHKGPVAPELFADGPTWKHTCAWSLWMLTSKQSAPMNRRGIETHLKLAQEHVWKALYPKMQALSKAEWRMYWQRVKRHFEASFSEKGAGHWKLAAAADARAEAIRSGKNEVEQAAAAAKAERLVVAMLKSGPQKTSPSPALRRAAVPISAPQGVSASLQLAFSKATMSVEASVNQATDASAQLQLQRRANLPMSSMASASVLAATAERYRDTPSRYLETRVPRSPHYPTEAEIRFSGLSAAQLLRRRAQASMDSAPASSRGHIARKSGFQPSGYAGGGQKSHRPRSAPSPTRHRIKGIGSR